MQKNSSSPVADKGDPKNSSLPEDNSIDEQLAEAVAEYQQLPPEEKEAIAVYSRLFSGPLPPPEMLEKYEVIVPGCAKTIISNMMDESSHRREVERRSMDDGLRYAKAGLTMAFIIAILGIGMGFAIALLVLLLANGWAQIAGILAGTALSGLSIVALVKKFIDGPTSKEQEAAPQELESGEKDN